MLNFKIKFPCEATYTRVLYKWFSKVSHQLATYMDLFAFQFFYRIHFYKYFKDLMRVIAVDDILPNFDDFGTL